MRISEKQIKQKRRKEIEGYAARRRLANRKRLAEAEKDAYKEELIETIMSEYALIEEKDLREMDIESLENFLDRIEQDREYDRYVDNPWDGYGNSW